MKEEAELQKIKQLESLGLVAAGIAHDFNNLLHVITGNIYLARSYVGPEDTAYKLLGDAEDICRSAKRLTGRLLTFSEGGSPCKTVFNINDRIRDWVAPILSGSNISYDLQLPDECYFVEADESQIREVIENVLINAKEAAPDGGNVMVRTKQTAGDGEGLIPPGKGHYVGVSVADNGPGIPGENLEKIFYPYFSTKGMGTQKGMGLGLTICHSIIKRHNGHIKVQSEKGKGTSFDIYLPLLKQKDGHFSQHDHRFCTGSNGELQGYSPNTGREQ
jgi:signal transduction histidine kinase